MAGTIDYTIAYDSGLGHTVDLCKIILARDGSYYLTAPYHPLNTAIAGIITVNYNQGPQRLKLEEAVELAVLDDDEKRLKLSHHPDGLLQFSGHGIISGLDAVGVPRGIGIRSWPLHLPTLGPSFGITFGNPLSTGRPSKHKPHTVVFEEESMAHLRKGLMGLRLAGYYLPANFREYVRRTGADCFEIGIVNPGAQAVLNLRVLLASKDSRLPGLIGLQAAPHGLASSNEGGFLVTSSTGNLRRNGSGDLLGDQLVCLYPRPVLDSPETARSLNLPLPAPPYSAPAGTKDVMPPSDAP